ncbi:acyl-coenzyme A synthetase ACSM3, mitochondrial isoform X1 [Monodelphis domestica]|uniref:acyl-coenzyme A synthetase ACSM3, mitochondrial isoform X1 n=1 Tax=Monodelphis domestica TaxID=13616 RepID=UPI0024E23567|nr:acyl-coenzyme A synthetase ACSM3, mitochondrial isoform X1 [Monodelphis domestica]XP_007498258.2 acyl-coenzyme A synthetase ACSM3, mitochondrial isoform X1 [Monodelphis domestica]XP_007498259.2 acyl-coenzyme A synthetase ACSM3, mitochondrial isoform X1 [Monodelphis domestica]XP_007498260.2 acyl-coenzyme A synthetase ACSM3, mitochondrial isoform X1 [Monodelphis domestica]XP_007498261.2 acyl-coenzyme A synthetase ACSM3, mitochondrial isoform X1 [Monodelphis domestica]XP_007498262.2 acyl-coenz
MNILLRTQCFQLLKISTVSVRAFHKDYRLSAAQNFSNYESIKRDFKLEVPEYFNFAKDVLDHWAKMEKVGKRPSNPAFWWINDHGEEVKWNFQELGSLSKKFANVLAESCGLQKGDRIIVVLPAIPEWWLANVACLRTGTVLIPGTIQLTEKDILYRLQASKAKCIITNDTLALTVDSIAHHCETLKYKLLVSEKPREGWGNLKEMMKHASDDHSCVMTRHNETMTIYFTSGTTGSPKMTEHTHSSYGMGLSVNGRYWLDLTPSDIMWNTSDTGWAKSAWSSVFAPWSQGACVFVHYMPRFEPVAILKTLSRFPITTFCSAPTVYRMLVLKWEPSYKFKSLKHCVSAGEPINPEVMDQWKNKTGLNIYEGYGQTETVLICGTFKGMKIKYGSMGKPSPAFDVKVIDENGNILPSKQEGAIGIRVRPNRPLGLFAGYVDEPSRTASAFCGDFYKTGDRGYMDEDGYFWFIARSDDVIISSGYRIGPFEVESALAEHPAVLESGVVSSPDPIRGEVVKAFVILKPDYKSYDPEKMKNELQEHVKRTTAPYKYPRKVEFVLELPKTVSGKIKRNELRKKEWEKV